MVGSEIETRVEEAKAGNREALEAVILHIQDRVFGLALRILGHPEDAEDAAQEILIRIITHLATFRGESSFTTWVYRISVNYLLSTRKRRAERQYSSFEEFAEQIGRGLASRRPGNLSEAEIALLAEEMMISCTQGMLLCLDRYHRTAYILGEVFEVNGEQGGYILHISPAAFRKRLSRARERLNDFMQHHCGIVNPANPCLCTKQITDENEGRQIEKSRLLFTGYPCRARKDPVVMKGMRELDELERVSNIFRSHPDYAAPPTFLHHLKNLMDSGRFQLFN
jgi:RNA polymerase sigma factor (sigma-70 family)